MRIGCDRLLEGGGQRLFAWANGPQALKPLLFAPEEPLWRAERGADGRFEFSPLLPEPEPLAVLGVRAVAHATSSSNPSTKVLRPSSAAFAR